MKSKLKIILALTVVAMAFGSTVCAQSSRIALGGDLVVGFDSNSSSLGIAPKIQYDMTTFLRGEFALATYPTFNNRAAMDLGLNIHFLIAITDFMSAYPVAGVGLFMQDSYSGNSMTSWRYGALGGGIEYALSSHFTINGELKYKFISERNDVGMLSAGLTYHF